MKDNKQTVVVNPTADNVEDDQGFLFKKKRNGNKVIKTLRIMRLLKSGELEIVTKTKKPETGEE